MEYAVCCDTMPNKSGSGKFMAEFALAMMCGLLLGDMLNGNLLFIGSISFSRLAS